MALYGGNETKVVVMALAIVEYTGADDGEKHEETKVYRAEDANRSEPLHGDGH